MALTAPFPILNVTTPADLLIYPSTVTNGLFGWVVLIVFFLVSFIALKGYTTKRAFTAASFICTILAILFFTIGILPPLPVFIFIIMTAGGVVSLQIERNR